MPVLVVEAQEATTESLQDLCTEKREIRSRSLLVRFLYVRVHSPAEPEVCYPAVVPRIVESLSRYYLIDPEPYFDSSSTISSAFNSEPNWDGVLPNLSSELTSAPCSSNNRTP